MMIGIGRITTAMSSEVTQTVNSSLDVQVVLDYIVMHAVQLSQAKEGTLYTIDHDALAQRANHGRSAETIQLSSADRVKLGSGSIGARCVALRKPVQIQRKNIRNTILSISSC